MVYHKIPHKNCRFLWGILLQIVIVLYSNTETTLHSVHFQVNSQDEIANNRHHSFHHR